MSNGGAGRTNRRYALRFLSPYDIGRITQKETKISREVIHQNKHLEEL